MNRFLFAIALTLLSSVYAGAQSSRPTSRQREDLTALIDQYTRARETRDTVLLRRILTEDVDQLVSTGEWRTGIRSAITGMLASSSSRPGKRVLTVDRIKLLGSTQAIVDCRYEIENPDGTIRRMWSSFLAVEMKGTWKISAIRNMLPSR